MTDCEDLVLSSWNSSAKKLLAGSWFTVKLTEVNKQSFFVYEVRTFCTGYDLNETIVEVGKSDISRINRLCYYYD
jgi:hypothetical protein